MSRMGPRYVRAMALGAAAVVMSGCWWGQPGYDSHHSGHNALASAITPSNAADVDREWSTAVPGITGTPVQSQAGLVHVTSTSGGLGNPTVGEVLAIRPATGQVAWRTPLAALHADAHPQLVASGDQLFVATFNSLTAPAGRLHRIDAATGSIIDSTPIGAAAAHELPASGRSSIVVAGPWVGTTFAFGSDGLTHLTMTNTLDPARTWSTTFDATREVAGPLIVGGVVHVVVTTIGASGDPTAAELWSWDLVASCDGDLCPPTITDLPTVHALSTSASADGGSLAIGTPTGLVVVDLATGEWWGDQTHAAQYDERRVPTWSPDALVVPRGDGIHTYPVDGCGAQVCEPLWRSADPFELAGQVASSEGILVTVDVQARLSIHPSVCTDPCFPLFEDGPVDGRATGPAILVGRRILVVHQHTDTLVAFGVAEGV